jgi:type I restriction enzyme R subunit
VIYIIDHLKMKGVMDPGLLYEQPYTSIHEMGVGGIF